MEFDEQLHLASSASASLSKEGVDFERVLLEKEDQIANLLEEKEYFITNLEKLARDLSEAKEALQEEAELSREKNELIQQLTLDNSKLKTALANGKEQRLNGK